MAWLGTVPSSGTLDSPNCDHLTVEEALACVEDLYEKLSRLQGVVCPDMASISKDKGSPVTNQSAPAARQTSGSPCQGSFQNAGDFTSVMSASSSGEISFMYGDADPFGRGRPFQGGEEAETHLFNSGTAASATCRGSSRGFMASSNQNTHSADGAAFAAPMFSEFERSRLVLLMGEMVEDIAVLTAFIATHSTAAIAAASTTTSPQVPPKATTVPLSSSTVVSVPQPLDTKLSAIVTDTISIACSSAPSGTFSTSPTITTAATAVSGGTCYDGDVEPSVSRHSRGEGELVATATFAVDDAGGAEARTVEKGVTFFKSTTTAAPLPPPAFSSPTSVSSQQVPTGRESLVAPPSCMKTTAPVAAAAAAAAARGSDDNASSGGVSNPNSSGRTGRSGGQPSQHDIENAAAFSRSSSLLRRPHRLEVPVSNTQSIILMQSPLASPTLSATGGGGGKVPNTVGTSSGNRSIGGTATAGGGLTGAIVTSTGPARPISSYYHPRSYSLSLHGTSSTSRQGGEDMDEFNFKRVVSLGSTGSGMELVESFSSGSAQQFLSVMMPGLVVPTGAAAAGTSSPRVVAGVTSGPLSSSMSSVPTNPLTVAVTGGSLSAQAALDASAILATTTSTAAVARFGAMNGEVAADATASSAAPKAQQIGKSIKALSIAPPPPTVQQENFPVASAAHVANATTFSAATASTGSTTSQYHFLSPSSPLSCRIAGAARYTVHWPRLLKFLHGLRALSTDSSDVVPQPTELMHLRFAIPGIQDEQPALTATHGDAHSAEALLPLFPRGELQPVTPQDYHIFLAMTKQKLLEIQQHIDPDAAAALSVLLPL